LNSNTTTSLELEQQYSNKLEHFGQYLAKNHARKIPIKPKTCQDCPPGPGKYFGLMGFFSSMIFG
jgi:hypothetical protein